MLALSIAARFLRRARGQSALIILGIAVGIATQVFVGSLITSLQADLIDTTVGSSPHITLTASDGGTVTGATAQAAATQPEVTAAIPVRKLSAIYAGDGDSVPLSITAGAAEDLDRVYEIAGRLSDGRYELDGAAILVGTGFASDAGVSPGDRLGLLLPDGRAVDFTVRGVFDLGSAAANDRIAFLGAASGADALGMGDDEFSAVEVQVADVFTSAAVAQRLAGQPGVTAVDWQAENEELLSGLAAQSGSSAMIQTFVLLAVALGIASTLAVSAVQKTRQIGILKAMGLRDGGAARIFLWQAGLLGAGGTACGVALGYALIWGFSFAPVDFSVRPQPGFIALSAAVGIAVSLLSAVLPARSTSRVDPIEVIQGG